MRLSTISNTDKILLIGIILAPMTGLRIGKIGPSELLVFIWCIINIRNIITIKITNYNFIFWIIFIFLIIFGSSYGIIYYPDQLRIVDVLTWIYLMFISLGIYQIFRLKPLKYSESFLKKIVTYSIIWYFFLYVYSLLISPYFLGAPLWYGNGTRFSGGATNPHQIAVLLGSFAPLTIKYIMSNNRLFKKMFYIILFFLCIFMGYETLASTLQLAFALSLSLLMLLIFLNRLQSKRIKFITLLLIIVALSSFIILNSELLINQFLTWVASDPNGLGRFEIYSTINETLEKNWIFGLGPGVHGVSGTVEYHNTYLEILAMSGILGLLNFIWYSIKSFKVLSIDIYFISSLLALYIYGLAGFSMRRLIYWSILALMLAIAEKKSYGKIL